MEELSKHIPAYAMKKDLLWFMLIKLVRTDKLLISRKVCVERNVVKIIAEVHLIDSCQPEESIVLVFLLSLIIPYIEDNTLIVLHILLHPWQYSVCVKH